jgi:DNA repair protein REV1
VRNRLKSYSYKQFSLIFYTILMSHADDLQAVSVDEALIDVTTAVEQIRAGVADQPTESSIDPTKELAEIIRAEVKKATSCEGTIFSIPPAIGTHTHLYHSQYWYCT